MLLPGRPKGIDACRETTDLATEMPTYWHRGGALRRRADRPRIGSAADGRKPRDDPRGFAFRRGSTGHWQQSSHWRRGGYLTPASSGDRIRPGWSSFPWPAHIVTVSGSARISYRHWRRPAGVRSMAHAGGGIPQRLAGDTRIPSAVGHHGRHRGAGYGRDRSARGCVTHIHRDATAPAFTVRQHGLAPGRETASRHSPRRRRHYFGSVHAAAMA